MASEQPIQLSKTELHQIEHALKDEKFRSMLCDYMDEISNPENRKLYEEQVTALEAQNGVDAVFVTPDHGYVLKASMGAQKIFINICKTDKAGKPECKRSTEVTKPGLNWSLPYIQAPGREDIDKNNIKCCVYDVMFHPDTYHLLIRNDNIKKMVEDIALEAVEKLSGSKVSRTGIKRPKMKYKGLSRPVIIRSENQNKSSKVQQSVITPEYTIKYRYSNSIQDYAINPRSKSVDAAKPSHLVVNIELPQIESAQDTELTVKAKTLTFRAALYSLSIALPCDIVEDAGSAKFDRDTHVLSVVIPIFSPDDNHSTLESVVSDEDMDISSKEEDVSIKEVPSDAPLVSNSICTLFPDYTVNYLSSSLEFVFLSTTIENVNIKVICPDVIHVMYSTVGSGLVRLNFSALMKVSSVITDANVSSAVLAAGLQVTVTGPACCDWSTCLVGPTLNELKTIDLIIPDAEVSFNGCDATEEVQLRPKCKYSPVPPGLKKSYRRLSLTDLPNIDENDVEKERHSSGDSTTSPSDCSMASASSERKVTPKSTRLRKSHSLSETDDTRSPGKWPRSILKVRRTVSLSDGSDDWGSSFDFDCTSLSMSQSADEMYTVEESEDEHIKKRVHFSRQVSRKLFRSVDPVLTNNNYEKKTVKSKKKNKKQRQNSGSTSESDHSSNVNEPNKSKKKKHGKKASIQEETESDGEGKIHETMSKLDISSSQEDKQGGVDSTGDDDVWEQTKPKNKRKSKKRQNLSANRVLDERTNSSDAEVVPNSCDNEVWSQVIPKNRKIKFQNKLVYKLDE